MSRLVKCTITKNLSRNLKKGTVVEYDPFKAKAWAKRGLLVLGEVEMPAAEVVEKSEPRKRKKTKPEPSEEDVDG